MIGLPEILIVLVLVFLLFGYRYLPSLGRKAGTGARDLKEGVEEVVGDKANPKNLARSAGKGVREAREFRDALTGKETPKASEAAEKPAPAKPVAEQPAPERDS